MTAPRYRLRSKLAALAISTAIALLIPFCIGAALGLYGPWYYAEARKIERLANEIPGVEVIEVDGNHDVTLQGIWLDLRYGGEPVYFQIVTAESFDRWTENLKVGWIGEWDLSWYSYPCEADEKAGNWNVMSGAVNFGPEGPLADRFDPPFRSIPDFLDRLTEAKALLEEFPEGWPGLRVVTVDGRIHHIRKEPVRDPR